MQYAYGMRCRGFSIGCQPLENLVERIEDTSGTYYDILIYSMRLKEEQVSQYELVYLGKIEKTT